MADGHFVLAGGMLLVLHQRLMHFFNLLKYQCFMEASQIFLLLPNVMAGETEARESRSLEQVRGRFESRSRLRAACLPRAAAQWLLPESSCHLHPRRTFFSRVSLPSTKPLSHSSGSWFGDRLEVSPPWTDFCCEWTRSDLQPA